MITVTLPDDHPIFRPAGGTEYQEALSDLVLRARRARALAHCPDDETRALMWAFHAAPSGSCGRHELHDLLLARGVTDFHGMDYGRPAGARRAA